MFYFQPCKLDHMYIFFSFSQVCIVNTRQCQCWVIRITCSHSIKPIHQVRYDNDIEEKNVYLSGSIDHHLVGRAEGKRRWVRLEGQGESGCWGREVGLYWLSGRGMTSQGTLIHSEHKDNLNNVSFKQNKTSSMIQEGYLNTIPITVIISGNMGAMMGPTFSTLSHSSSSQDPTHTFFCLLRK